MNDYVHPTNWQNDRNYWEMQQLEAREDKITKIMNGRKYEDVVLTTYLHIFKSVDCSQQTVE